MGFFFWRERRSLEGKSMPDEFGIDGIWIG